VIGDIVQRLDLTALARQLGPRADSPFFQRMREIWLAPNSTSPLPTSPELRSPDGAGRCRFDHSDQPTDRCC
jgi:hypothetical protein